MYRMIFKNWKIAALFFVLTVMTATQLVGTEEKGGQLDDVQQQVLAQRQKFVAATREKAAVSADEDSQSPDAGFTPSDTLIDDAQGYDPTPADPSETADINGPVLEPAGPIDGY